jgi:hypothetical protein
MLTTREIATLIWFVPTAALMWWKLPGIREPIRALVRIASSPVILVPSVLFTVWMVGVIFLGARLDAWDWARLKDTLYWFVPAYILLFGAVNAATEAGFFRRRLRDAVGVSVFLGFYLTVATLDLAWELVLVPVLTILSLIVAFGGVTLGGTTALSKRAGNRSAGVIALIVLGLVVNTTVNLVQNRATTDWGDLARSLALPVWLTVFALPFVWAMSAFVEYDTALRHMRNATPKGRRPWKSVLALLVSFRFRRSALHRFAGHWPRELVMAKGFREARAVIARHEAELAEAAAAKQKAADDLKRYAGATGVDARGRPLDKREFKETTDALETLANAHMGWYRSHGNRYQRDLLERFGDVYARGLPAEHGITMRVSGSGQSWYAWRRTPSGLCFGIGAAGPPPDQRFFEGTEPPGGSPKVSAGWLPPHERGPNWEWVDDPNDEWHDDPLAEQDGREGG